MYLFIYNYNVPFKLISNGYYTPISTCFCKSSKLLEVLCDRSLACSKMFVLCLKWSQNIVLSRFVFRLRKRKKSYRGPYLVNMVDAVASVIPHQIWLNMQWHEQVPVSWCNFWKVNFSKSGNLIWIASHE